MTRYEKIKEILENMDSCGLVNIHNEYCGYDDCIYSMEEFDEIMSGQTPEWIAHRVYYGDFCPAHDYFWFNGYGNLESADYIKGKIDIDEIASWIDENENPLNCEELEDLFAE